MVLTDEVLTAIDAIAEAEKRSRSQVADIVLRAGLATVSRPLARAPAPVAAEVSP